MARRIDLLGLFDWSMVEPEDNVTVIVEVRPGHGDRLVRFAGEDGKRAGGIETDTTDRISIDVMLADCSLNGDTDATPDICS